MKLVLAAVGLVVALGAAGMACGPLETFCYNEGVPCSQVRPPSDADLDASDAAEMRRTCFDNLGNEIVCPQTQTDQN